MSASEMTYIVSDWVLLYLLTHQVWWACPFWLPALCE